MKRNHNKSKKREEIVSVWTHAQAQNAVPYLRSIMRSVRDHRLEAIHQRRSARRLAAQPGRPNRHTLITQQETDRAGQRAADRFQEALQELQDLGIYCLDPIRGEALVPFVNESQLAWFVFDLFDKQPFRFWRYHNDSLETRRPITDVKETTPDGTAIV